MQEGHRLAIGTLGFPPVQAALSEAEQIRPLPPGLTGEEYTVDQGACGPEPLRCDPES